MLRFETSALHWDIASQIVHLTSFIMFITVPTRTSDAIESLKVDLLARKARVIFQGSYEYEYENVSARAIIQLLFSPDVSLGFWVNANCKAKGVKCREITPTSFYKQKLAKVRLVQEPVLPQI